MNMFKCWAGVMIAVLFLAKVAVARMQRRKPMRKASHFLEEGL